jgi:hypothetical protein
MAQVSAQIDRARDLVTEMIELARGLLDSGADVDRIHREYVTQALDLLTEIEVQGLLAASGHRSSMIAIENQIGRLSRLKQKATQELDRYSDRD